MDYKSIKYLLNIKENVETVGFATPYTVNKLVNVCIGDIEYIDRLNKQLEYSLSTGGEFLSSDKIERIIN